MFKNDNPRQGWCVSGLSNEYLIHLDKYIFVFDYTMNNKYILGGITTLVLIYIVVYIVKAKLGKPKETKGSHVCELFYFYTTWCPYCKKSMPVWRSFKDEIGNKKIKGYTVNFLEVDCDKDTTLADKFNVQGYPTIKLVNGNQVIEYDAKPDKDTLMQFLTTSL